MRQRVFLCAAENPIHALCPLLELAEQCDNIIVLGKNDADGKKSTQHLLKALHNFGFHRGQIEAFSVDDWEDGPSLIRALERAKTLLEGNDVELCVIVDQTSSVVLPTLAGLQALRHLSIVRNEPSRVAYSLWHKDQQFRHGVVSYRRTNVDLVVILQLTGHKLFASGSPEPVRVWPRKYQTTGLEGHTPYGYDAAWTISCHENNWLPSQVGVKQNQTLSKESLDQWRKSWQQYQISRSKSDQVYLCLYHATKNALGNGPAWCTPEEGVERLRKATERMLELGQGSDQAALWEIASLLTKKAPGVPLGQIFEAAVARRLADWLDGGGASYARLVQSVWKNVRVCREADTETVIAEFDVLVVLRNGSFIVIECKCGSVEGLKDWQARRETLGRINAGGAMVACTPLYTGYANRPWFIDQLKNVQYLREVVALPLLIFSLPGQPRVFRLSTGSENLASESWEMAPFEECLCQLLDTYAPREETFPVSDKSNKPLSLPC